MSHITALFKRNGVFIFIFMKFAYNEMSFMLIRLLQQVTEIKLVQQVNPNAVPAPGYADSRISDGSDTVIIESHLTMFVEVSETFSFRILSPYSTTWSRVGCG